MSESRPLQAGPRPLRGITLALSNGRTIFIPIDAPIPVSVTASIIHSYSCACSDCATVARAFSDPDPAA